MTFDDSNDYDPDPPPIENSKSGRLRLRATDPKNIGAINRATNLLIRAIQVESGPTRLPNDAPETRAAVVAIIEAVVSELIIEWRAPEYRR